MESTPQRPSRSDAVQFTVAADQSSSPRRSPRRIKKPPPITPRRFTRFFTPRQANASKAARGLRKALRDVPSTALNVRQNELYTPPPRKRRKLSFQSIPSSIPSSPAPRVGFLSSSQDPPPDQEDDPVTAGEDDVDSEASTDIEEQTKAGHGMIRPYRRKGTSASLLAARLGGRRPDRTTSGQDLYLHETSNFYSLATDVNVDNGPPPSGIQHRSLSLPFCATSCKTNPLVAVGDEEGHVRLIDSANECAAKFAQSFLVMKPHDNAVMDLEFSDDDNLLATASGDQTCHIIDVQGPEVCLFSHRTHFFGQEGSNPAWVFSYACHLCPRWSYSGLGYTRKTTPSDQPILCSQP